MVILVLRRIRVQRRLLAGVLALVTTGVTFLGVYELLLSETQDRAFTAGVRLSDPEDVAVTAFLVDLAGSDAPGVRDEARGVLAGVLAPIGSTQTSTTVGRMRRLGSTDQVAYVSSTDEFAERAALTSGRPSQAPGEAVVPDETARRLHLALGDRVTLGAELGADAVDQPVDVTVVGTFRTTTQTGWASDPLSGTGFEADYSDGLALHPAYGPFVVDESTFAASGSGVASLQVTGHPRLSAASQYAMATVVDDLGAAQSRLSARVGDRVRRTRVASDLPVTLDVVRSQASTTRSVLLATLLLGTTLVLTALVLAGRVLAGVRAEEQRLLKGIGLGRAQLVATTLAEAVVLALLAAMLAVPGAAVAHSVLTRLPPMTAAGLGQGPTVTAGLVATVLVGALLLALALVVPVLGSERAPTDRRPRPAVPAHAATDLLLVAVVVASWWQLRAQRSAPADGSDVLRTMAPAVCLVATVALLVRVLPLLLEAVPGLVARSPTLVVPLALTQVARRPHAAAGLGLIALAAATATSGLAFHATWLRSQNDQADLGIGTDLSLALDSAPTGQQAAAVAAAASSPPSVLSQVTRRPLALGRYVGEAGSPPTILALDTRRADLLRGRADDTWAEPVGRLAPGPSVVGLSVPAAGAGVTIAGQTSDGLAVLATPTVVLQDRAGFRSTLSGDAVALDGRSHPVDVLADLGPGSRLVAIRLVLATRAGGGDLTGRDDVTVALTIPRSVSGGGLDQPWSARALDPVNTPALGASASVAATPTEAVLTTTTTLRLDRFAYADPSLVMTAFEVPPDIPVAISRQLADAVGARVGSTLGATVDALEVTLRVAAVVSTVPSLPGRDAVLADVDTLSRALIGAGNLEPAVDAWWVGHPSSATAHALQSSGLGEVSSRAQARERLIRGPMGVSMPAGLLVLVAAAFVLLVAGAGVLLGSEIRSGSADMARLRALGLARGGARRLVLAEHTVLLLVLLASGTLVGVAASVALAGSLVRSDVGAVPVPSVVVVWPWVAEGLLVAGLALACLGVATAVTHVALRRTHSAHPRSDVR